MNKATKLLADGGLPPLDRYLRALTDRHRRYLLYYLDEYQVATVEELARHIAAWEADRPPSELSEAAYDHIQTELHHQHIPQLKDYGLVDYDERSNDLCLANPPQTFMKLLHICNHVEEHP